MQTQSNISPATGSVSKSKRKRRRTRIIVDVILTIAVIIFLMPLFVLLMTSFKTFDQVIGRPTSLFPDPWIFTNYVSAVTDFNFFLYLWNSLKIVIVTLVGTILSASLTAYAFTAFEVKERGFILALYMACMMLPSQVMMIPMYEIFRTLNWTDTYLPFWIPPFLGGGITNVFLIRQFFMSIPRSLSEAAEIDGAGEMRIFLQIVIPLCIPVLCTVGIFTFIGSWNDFFTPLLYLNKMEMRPLAYAFFNYFETTKVGDTKQWNLISAAGVLTMIPTVLLFIAAQKYFVDGIALSGIKG